MAEDKMVDLGEKFGCETAGSPKRKKFYPSINLTSKQMPGLKMDKDVTMMIKGRVVSMRSHRGEADNFSIELEKAKLTKEK